MRKQSRRLIIALLSGLLLVASGALADSHTKTPFKIQDAEWREQTEELRVEGHGQFRCIVEIFNAGSGEYLGFTEVPDKRWSFEAEDLELVPCRVAAHQVETEYCRYVYDEMDVQRAPDDCGPNLEQYFFWQ
jgi:hypothetical protein